VKHTGLTLCSKDVFALDVVASEFMGLDPKTVPHLIAAKKLGVYPEIVDFTGDTFAPCPQPFILPDAVKSPSFSNSVPSFLSKPALWVMNTMLRSFPNVDKEKCIGCGKCAESCPQHIIEVKNRKASMPRKGCISCFCCQEMCPAHAISAKRAINL
jgi:ferredoxin